MKRFSTACQLAFATLLLASAGAATAQVRVPIALTEAAPGHKPVRTLRDLRYRDLVPQRYDFSCGSAALASLLRYGYGLQTSEPELIKRMINRENAQEVIRNGFSMLDMKNYVESIGFRGHGFRVPAESLYQLQLPVIALLDLKGYKHFVVVKGAASGRVFIADPALGNRVMREEEFVQGWNGIVLAVLSDRPLIDSYLVNGKRSLALGRRLDTLAQATLPVPVVELGLVRADLL